ncbi:RNA-directed DNA polymerase [Patescibacteria group bacterium]|nr:RNA-directed DNA polymerase [Patescibacteria group bacterium]
MISYEKINKYVGRRFWKHIQKETLIPYNEVIPKREEFLKNLTAKIEKMQYVPSPPRAYVVSHKQNLVVRFIPTMTLEDYCVYFFCIKCLEDEIAKNRIKGTYGGWRLGGKIRKIENFDDAPSVPDSSYNKFEWMKAWTEYQQKAYKFYQNNNFQYFIVFDIANFYDSVRLSRLEMLLREATQKNKTPIVNLLFYFLSNWGKRDLNYERQNTGLPQDEVGDCSRILANFYLQDYDQRVYRLATLKNAGYLRYADDQIIAARDETTAKEIMFLASKELAKIGLNLNASKAKFFKNREKFKIYWSFDIFKLLTNKNNKKSIEKAFHIFIKRNDTGVEFKSDTVLKRFLSCNLYRLSSDIKNKILDLVNQKDFLTSISDYYLKRIYELTPKVKKNEFLKNLKVLSGKILFNQFHLRIIKFMREKKIHNKYLSQIKANLIKLGDLNF